MAERIGTYDEFWAFYLNEHSKPLTRYLHFVGTHLGTLCALVGLATLNWRLLVAYPVCAYGFAWGSHFFIEKNKPATFTYPLWSLISDYRMVAFMWTGKLPGELQRHLKPAA